MGQTMTWINNWLKIIFNQLIFQTLINQYIFCGCSQYSISIIISLKFSGPNTYFIKDLKMKWKAPVTKWNLFSFLIKSLKARRKKV